jgi:hypothetical protein
MPHTPLLKVASPGPGEYEPRRLSSTTQKFAGSAAFRSHSDRSKWQVLRETNDPGLYQPPNMTIAFASSSARSFSRKERSGAGGFGSVSERPTTGVFRDAPPPGTYTVKGPAAQGSFPKHGTRQFNTQSARINFISRRYGPDASMVDRSATQKRTTGGESMFRSSSARFLKPRGGMADTDYWYAPANHTLAHAVFERNRRRNSLSAAFDSKSAQGLQFATPTVTPRSTPRSDVGTPRRARSASPRRRKGTKQESERLVRLREAEQRARDALEELARAQARVRR